jgi:DNA-binding CsgD family transcriptional regulator
MQQLVYDLEKLYPYTDEQILDFFRKGTQGRVSEKQFQCLLLYTMGKKDDEIAQLLDISPRDAHDYRAQGRQKLHLEGIATAAREAILQRRVHYVMVHIAKNRGEFYPYFAGQDVQFTVIDPHTGEEILLWKEATSHEVLTEQQTSPIPKLIMVAIFLGIFTLIMISAFWSLLHAMFPQVPLP